MYQVLSYTIETTTLLVDNTYLLFVVSLFTNKKDHRKGASTLLQGLNDNNKLLSSNLVIGQRRSKLVTKPVTNVSNIDVGMFS